MRASYFFPDFLMPWPPVLSGPLPPAFAAISFRAFSSGSFIASVTMVVQGWRDRERNSRGYRSKRTGPFLLLEGQIVFVELLIRLLGCLERLGLSACVQMSATIPQGCGLVIQGVRTLSVGATHLA